MGIDAHTQASLICLGEIVAAQGLKGWVRVKTFTENPADLISYGSLYTDSRAVLTLKIMQIKSENLVITSIDNCQDRNSAEALVGCKLYIERDQLPPSKENEFYYHDLIDMRVFDEHTQLVGITRTVENYGAGDFLEIVDTQQKVYTLPFNKDSVVKVDQNAGIIYINRSFLL